MRWTHAARRIGALCSVGCCSVQTVRADIGLPMIFLSWPGMVFALLPVIFVETIILVRRLSLRVAQVMPGVSIANMISTGVGIPITWLALVIGQQLTGGGRAFGLDSFSGRFLAVTWQAPWLIPYESDLFWMIPAAMLTLLVPYFFMTWAVEYLIIRQRLVVESRVLIRTVGIANLVSYSMLALLLAAWFVAAYFFRWGA